MVPFILFIHQFLRVFLPRVFDPFIIYNHFFKAHIVVRIWVNFGSTLSLLLHPFNGHVQTVCTSLQTDNHTNTSSLDFYRPDAVLDSQPTMSKRWRQSDCKFGSVHTHTFNGPLSGTTQVSQYQKRKTNRILLKQATVSGSGISWAICKSAPRFRQITTPAPHHSVFTGRMPFLPPNQQHQSSD